MLQRADGSYTGDAEEIDDLLHKAWDQFFCMYQNRDEPDWTSFAMRFQHHIESFPMKAERLTGAGLKRTLTKMRDGAACGMDGWRVRELKKLPLPILARLANFFDVVEDTG
eukprot:1312456-Karenia_brevis.AAC.1